MSLLQSTQLRLGKCISKGFSLRMIAEHSNGRVPYEWLKKFAAGKIDNPGVTTIEDLHDCLGELAEAGKRRTSTA